MSSISCVKESFIDTPKLPDFTEYVSSHVLSGLCKIGGYEVLRHGTTWSRSISILQNGADPHYGGSITRSAFASPTVITYEPLTDISVSITEANAKGRFYVFRDSTFDGGIPHPLSFLFKRLLPIFHSFLAYRQDSMANSGGIFTKWMCVVSIVKAIFTPKLKFIYTLEEIPSIFEDDPDYTGETAYRTSQPLSADRIGLGGLINHLESARVWTHIKEHPGKAIQGIAQLAIGILLTAIPGLGYLT